MRTGGGPPPVAKPEETPTTVILELIWDELRNLENEYDCDGPESALQETSNGIYFFIVSNMSHKISKKVSL